MLAASAALYVVYLPLLHGLDAANRAWQVTSSRSRRLEADAMFHRCAGAVGGASRLVFAS